MCWVATEAWFLEEPLPGLRAQSVTTAGTTRGRAPGALGARGPANQAFQLNRLQPPQAENRHHLSTSSWDSAPISNSVFVYLILFCCGEGGVPSRPHCASLTLRLARDNLLDWRTGLCSLVPSVWTWSHQPHALWWKLPKSGVSAQQPRLNEEAAVGTQVSLKVSLWHRREGEGESSSGRSSCRSRLSAWRLRRLASATWRCSGGKVSLFDVTRFRLWRGVFLVFW